MTDTPRRQLLRVGVKLMFLAALAVSAYVLISSTGDPTPQRTAPPSLRIDLAADAHAPFRRIPWAGGNLLLLHRSPAILAGLEGHDALLLDPQSQDARQPAALKTQTRSRQPEYFLAYDRGDGLGCPLQWLAPGSVREAPLRPWAGGFRDTCSGSWYDAAGRVFLGQAAQRNLAIPDYRISAGLLEVGPSGDNAAPVK